MPYATAADIEERIGADRYKVLADLDRDGVVGATEVSAVDDACAEASSFGDSYISQYLPIATPPDVLVRAVIDIAVYTLAGNRATTDERQRRDDAVAWLEHISIGRASLNLPTGASPTTTSIMLVDALDAKYTHDQTRRVL